MLPPHQQHKSTALQASLSFIPSDAHMSLEHQVPFLNSEQVRETSSGSAGSRETWPAVDPITGKKAKNRKEEETDYGEKSVVRRVSDSDKISLQDVSRERVEIISERMRLLPDVILLELKNELRFLLEGTGSSKQREEFFTLQKFVQSRADLTAKNLLTAHRVQLEILVSIKTGIQAFLHPNISLSQTYLIEVFIYKRCRNIACQSQLPSDDCPCEFCTNQNGFCNHCMCLICNKFDFEVNTFRWVGCDSCGHWTHTDCAIHEGEIGMSSCVNSSAGLIEMLFRCRACNSSSALLGWVKDVFQHCAPAWDREVLLRELDFVGRIFQRSEDPRGRKLFLKCEDLVEKMKNGIAMSTACKAMLLFFQEIEVDPMKNPVATDGGHVIAPQEACDQIVQVVHETISKMELVAEDKMQMFKKARLALEVCDREIESKAREVVELKMERQRRKQQIIELEGIVRLKQAEADMFQLKASEARRESDRLQRIMLDKSEKTEEDYADRYLKQRLNEVELEKQFLFEKIKLQESSRVLKHSDPRDDDPSQILMLNKIQDLLENNVRPKADDR